MSNRQSSQLRREFLLSSGATLGSIAFLALCEESAEAETPAAERLAHHVARAKSCIFLVMEGGPSHIDTFDPKPALERLHLQTFQRGGEKLSGMASGKRYYVQSPFEFRKAGESAADMSVEWRHLARVADRICFYRGLQAESVNHPTALYHLNTGNRFGGDPAVGAWVNYGLGSMNRDLPGFVVLPELAHPQGGAANWSNGYLPAVHQGTPLRPEGSPILDLEPALYGSEGGPTRSEERTRLDLIRRMNQRHLEDHPAQEELQARLESYELAYRMQSVVPQALDIEREPDSVKRAYGLDSKGTAAFGRKCLLARKLVEQGVRFVQAYHGSWDSHDNIQRAHSHLIANVDQPITALIEDLASRGLLDETLIVWCGEFGRTPDNGVRNGTAYGRDHNPQAMTVWLAGGGVKAGHTVGATDELGERAFDIVHPLRDFHVTLLHLLGLDDRRLTYYHAGRFKQLSQFGGKVIRELLA